MNGGVSLVAGFVSSLRIRGLNISLSRTVSFTEAVERLGIDKQSNLYWAGRATLLSNLDDISIYDECFQSYFLAVGREAMDLAGRAETVLVLSDEADLEEPVGEGEEEITYDSVLTLRFSETEVLKTKDFASCSELELKEAAVLMAKFRWHSPQRLSRRYGPSKQGGRPDMRRSMRWTLRHGGELGPLRVKKHRLTKRQTVFICDISGSMEAYSRALLRFVHSALMGVGKVEVFTLSTRLTRITRELSSKSVDEALESASHKVADWSGGTRLGEGIGQFNSEWGVRGMARNATVVILSDGWDRGSSDLLADEMARLKRVAHRIIWVNPLRATLGYSPLARGMSTALPFVDDFIDGHSLKSLESLAEVISSERTPQTGTRVATSR